MPSILLVDDSLTQSTQIKMLLESGEHTVDCCEDGSQALKHLANSKNDLVVTDMEMPIMNGLDLIKQMQIDFPEIPAVLVTGFGSERLAAEALKLGATAYVPKALLAEMLLGTIDNVLGILNTDRSYAKLIDCTDENRLVFTLPSDPVVASSAINLVMQMACGMNLLTGAESYRVGMALDHAMSNALYRGNLELSFGEFNATMTEEYKSYETHPVVEERLQDSKYAKRKIHFDARLLRDLIRVVIRDSGVGFDYQQYVPEDCSKHLATKHGQGLTLIHNFMDKVNFNGAGNEITMIKHCTQGS